MTGLNTNRLYMIDGNTLTYVDNADVGIQPWGVAVHGGKVYVANFGGRTISVLDAETLAQRSTIPETGQLVGKPTFVRVNPVTDRVIAVLYPDNASGGNQIVVIDPNSDMIEAHADVGGGGAWGLAVDTNLNRIYVSTAIRATFRCWTGMTPMDRSLAPAWTKPAATTTPLLMGWTSTPC